jgi:acetoin utilization deacetylase AcuC-like enzyme
MPVYFSPLYHHPLPPSHRFPMERYWATQTRLRETLGLPPLPPPPATLDDALAQAPPLSSSLTPSSSSFEPGRGPSLASVPAIVSPPAASLSDCALAHAPSFVDAYAAGTLSAEETKRIGFEWSPLFLRRTLLITGGTVEATRVALTTARALRLGREEGGGGSGAAPKHPLRGGGIACNAAGGTHHAFASHGEGFCIFNDVAVAIRVAQQQQQRLLTTTTAAPPHVPRTTPSPPTSSWGVGLSRACVLDLDVHQGNGTASIFSRDPSVVTVSVHGRGNYPWSSRFPSTFDVDVPDGETDDGYLAHVRDALAVLDGLIRLPDADIAALQLENERIARAAGWGAEVLPPVSVLAEVGGGRGGGGNGRGGAANDDDTDTSPRTTPLAPRPAALKAAADARHVRLAAAEALRANLPVRVDALFFQAGVDPLIRDRLGRLKVTRSGLRERNALVFAWAEARGLPVVVTMGGGYARPIEASAQAHVDVFMQAAEAWRRRGNVRG